MREEKEMLQNLIRLRIVNTLRKAKLSEKEIFINLYKTMPDEEYAKLVYTYFKFKGKKI